MRTYTRRLSFDYRMGPSIKKEAVMSEPSSFVYFFFGILTMCLYNLIRKYYRRCAVCGDRLGWSKLSKPYCRGCFHEKIDSAMQEGKEVGRKLCELGKPD